MEPPSALGLEDLGMAAPAQFRDQTVLTYLVTHDRRSVVQVFHGPTQPPESGG